MKFSEILSRLDIAHPQDGGYIAHCPVPTHPDSTPSFSVRYIEDGSVSVHCFGHCEREAILDALGVTEKDLLRVENDAPEITPTRGTSTAPVDEDVSAHLDRTATLATTWLRDGATSAREYVLRRWGATVEDVERLRLGFLAQDGGRVLVVFNDGNGRPVGCQGRALRDDVAARWAGVAAKDAHLWPVGFVGTPSGVGPVLICEGPGDAVTAAAAGFDAVAVTGASKGRFLTLLSEWLTGRDLVTAGDSDASGARLNETVAEIFGAVRVLALPEGINDLSEWQEKHPETFREALRAAVNAAESTKKPEAPSGAVFRAEAVRTDTSVDLARSVLAMIRANGEDLAFTKEAGWLVWDGTVWSRIAEEAIRGRVHALGDLIRLRANEKESEYLTNPPTGSEEEVEKERTRRAAEISALRAKARPCHRSASITDALRELPAQAGVFTTFETFDQDPDLLQAANGVIDLRTGTIRAPRKEDRITRRLSVNYRPEAAAPRWEQFLGEIFVTKDGDPDPEVAAFMRRLIGYGITGHVREQVFAVLYGQGGNGKGKFTETLRDVFLPVTSVTPFATFEAKPVGSIPNDLAALKGARLVLASEGEAGTKMAEATIKSLTGADTISARFMRQEFFEFTPSFLILLSTNFQPKFRGQDDGLWRRVKMVPFRRYFGPEERDERLSEKLLAEREGILSWAVRGAVEWSREGLRTPAVIEEETTAFRRSSDVLGEFIGECMEVSREFTAPVKAAEVWAAYRLWCADEGVENPYGRNLFLDMLSERPGITKEIRPNRSVIFRGLRLLSEHERAFRDKGEERRHLTVIPGGRGGANLGAI